MSLYTPVFPPLHEFNSSQKASLESNSQVPIGKQQNYVKYLRDLHLFLSTQSDVLSPSSRPNSPSADQRVQRMKNKIQDIFIPSAGEASSEKWTRAGRALKLRCAMGRCWSVTQADPCGPEQNTDWILPDEESEWIEWEKKREENRRLKGKTKASQQIGSVIPATPESHKYSVGGRSRRSSTQRRPPDVSPGTLLAATEKVKKWQASMFSERWHDTSRTTLPVSGRARAASEGKRETAGLRRSRTLGFAVVKPVAKSFIGKKRRGSASYTAIRDNSTPAVSREPKMPTKTLNVADNIAPVDGDKMTLEGSAKTPSVRADVPKIANVSETLYLPPSFPSDLETSTPLPNSRILVRTKPPPILPVSSSTPQPSTPANPSDDLQVISVQVHVTNELSFLPPQVDPVRQGKRSRAPSGSVDRIPDDPPVTPSAKRPRILSQNSFPLPSKPISPNGASNDARDPSAIAPSRNPLNSPEVAVSSGKNDQPFEDDAHECMKIPSPTKSVKSYFSTPDPDPADALVTGNLLLESPVSPMLSYAQNASVFRPQITSTQVRKGSLTPGGASNDIFGLGYSSQFDVERHVDRISELLERDVDFDGWLRDTRTVEMSQD